MAALKPPKVSFQEAEAQNLACAKAVNAVCKLAVALEDLGLHEEAGTLGPIKRTVDAKLVASRLDLANAILRINHVGILRSVDEAEKLINFIKLIK